MNETNDNHVENLCPECKLKIKQLEDELNFIKNENNRLKNLERILYFKKKL